MNRLIVIVCALCLVACGGAAHEESDPGLDLTRLRLPDASQAPFEVTVGAEHVACAEQDCELGVVDLPTAPVELHVLDALGNEFTFSIDDLAEGPHVIEAPLAPEAGVFLTYTLEYHVR